MPYRHARNDTHSEDPILRFHRLVCISCRVRHLILVLAIIVGLTPLKNGSFGTTPARAATGNQGLEFGALINDNGQRLLTPTVLDQVVASGAGWVKINFRLGEFQSWTETTTFGYSALSLYDQIVDDARARGLRVYGLLSNEAWHGWLELWQQQNAEKGLGNGNNFYVRNFSTYAAVVLAQHFAGRIDTWEIWNEPNLSQTYMYPSNFAWLLTHVYEDTRLAGVTNVTFVLGAIASLQDRGRITPDTSGATYLTAVYQQGQAHAEWLRLQQTYGSYPFDLIAQHLYIDRMGRTKASNIRTTLKYVRDAFVQHEGSATTKKTIISEIGWATNVVSEKTQADNLKIAYTEFRNTPYVMNAYWFFLRDETYSGLFFGLLRADNTEKPAWNMYKRYANY